MGASYTDEGKNGAGESEETTSGGGRYTGKDPTRKDGVLATESEAGTTCRPLAARNKTGGTPKRTARNCRIVKWRSRPIRLLPSRITPRQSRGKPALEGLDVRGLEALGSFGYLEFNRLAIV